MRRAARAALVALALAPAPAPAGEGTISPPEDVTLDGVPPIPAAVGKALAPYDEFRSHAMLAWHPLRPEMLVRLRLPGARNEALLVKQPGAAPEAIIGLPGDVGHAAFEPRRGEYLVFTRSAEAGGEPRLYREDVASREISALSPEGESATGVAWTRRGDRLAYMTRAQDREPPGRERALVHVVDPLRAASDRVLARLEGAGWSQPAFSEDGRHLVLVQALSARASRLWVMDAATGKRRAVTRGDAAYAEPRFARDGRSIFAIAARAAAPRRLVQVFLSGKERTVSHVTHSVEDFDISFDAKRIAFTTEEEGSDVLRFIDLGTLKELPRPPLVPGVIRRLRWRPGTDEVAFDVVSARSAGDVFSYEVARNQLTRWTNGNSPHLNTSAFVEPGTIRWKGADGRDVTGLLYRAPGSFKGKRPVIVSIDRAPGAPARTGFIGRDNYLVGELGVALVRPDVREPSAVADVAGLLAWIAAQPDLDASRVAIVGRGEGVALALDCARSLGRPLLAAQDGPEAFMAHARAQRAAGDLRARSIPAWLLFAHAGGFEEGPDARFLSEAAVEFAKRTLLKPGS
ncbi:MAG TPA: hypothetical protein VEG27_14385 [Usitatibacter sp.]|nr:hypothetical protein [Usitatibacter sp.]